MLALGLIGSGQDVYQRVVGALTKARLNGTIPFEWIDDRTRHVGFSDSDCPLEPDEAMEAAEDHVSKLPFIVRGGRWLGQRNLVSVWIEKEALAGVLEPVCDALDIGLFCCRGYPSLTALHTWVHTTHEGVREQAQGDWLFSVDDNEWEDDDYHKSRPDVDVTAVILYMGDHDPDGLQIPRTVVSRISEIQEVVDCDFNFRLERIALTIEQIREYNPPPFWAKPTSSRFQGYLDETGLNEAWELDALEPEVMQQLVRDHVGELFDSERRREVRRVVGFRREEFTDQMREDGWFARALDG